MITDRWPASLPVVRDELVVQRHMITDHQLNAAVVITRSTPGQVGVYVVSVGYFADGVLRAIAGWLAMATPRAGDPRLAPLHRTTRASSARPRDAASGGARERRAASHVGAAARARRARQSIRDRHCGRRRDRDDREEGRCRVGDRVRRSAEPRFVVVATAHSATSFAISRRARIASSGFSVARASTTFRMRSAAARANACEPENVTS